MKRLFYTTLITAAFVLAGSPASASACEKIPAGKAVVFPDGSLVAEESDDYGDAIDEWMTVNLPACDLREYGLHFDSDNHHVYLSVQDMERYRMEQDYVDTFCNAAMEAIVPDGADRGAVIDAAVKAASETLRYDDKAADEEGETLSLEQGAYYSLTEGKGLGVCASYSHLFYCLVNAVPFNESGVVDWHTDNPVHPIDVRFVRSDDARHIWNAVIDEDGTMEYYDVTQYDDDFIRTPGKLGMTKDTLSKWETYTGTDNDAVKLTITGRNGLEIKYIDNKSLSYFTKKHARTIFDAVQSVSKLSPLWQVVAMAELIFGAMLIGGFLGLVSGRL